MKSAEIRIGGLAHPDVIALLTLHHHEMRAHSPVASVHALDLSALSQSDVTFFSVWQQDALAAIGALKQLSGEHAEIKSMRTAPQFIRQGFAQYLLTHMLRFAEQQHYLQLSLETGTAEAFKPAHRLYQTFGFAPCPPFADYREDPYSCYMTKSLV